MKRLTLTGNQLKLIALIAMTIDHVGMILLPQYLFLRIIGRLAFPIYAYMIAEGCRYTRNIFKYLGTMAAVALLCQVVSFAAIGSLYQSVLVTFSLSVLVILLIKNAGQKKNALSYLLLGLGIAGVFFVTKLLPELLPGTDFGVDYGFVGVMLPVLVYLAKDRRQAMAFTAICLVLLAYGLGQVQWFGLLALPLLWLYNGKRGAYGMKYLFYIYYPAHLATIYLLQYVL